MPGQSEQAKVSVQRAIDKQRPPPGNNELWGGVQSGWEQKTPIEFPAAVDWRLVRCPSERLACRVRSARRGGALHGWSVLEAATMSQTACPQTISRARM